jgi:hypothetical protein
MRVLVTRRPSGRWRVEQVGRDGKRRLLPDVLLPDEAAEPEIPGFLEAAFHEMGRPGERITRLD